MKMDRAIAGITPRTRSAPLMGVRGMRATIGRIATYPVIEKSASTMTMTATNATLVATGLGRRANVSTTLLTGPANAMAAAGWSIQAARVLRGGTRPPPEPHPGATRTGPGP